MSTSNFNLRCIPHKVMLTLKQKANISRIGYSRPKKKIYHDLDELAGTWSAREEKAFKKNPNTLNKLTRIFG